jgi:hypothetical protein
MPLLRSRVGFDFGDFQCLQIAASDVPERREDDCRRQQFAQCEGLVSYVMTG